MSLLSVLNTAVVEDSHLPVSIEEEVERTQCVVIATRAITTLLLHTQLRPKSGQPHASHLLFEPRDAHLPFLSSPMGQKLCRVREIVQSELNTFHSPSTTASPLRGLERDQSFASFNLGQVKDTQQYICITGYIDKLLYQSHYS